MPVQSNNAPYMSLFFFNKILIKHQARGKGIKPALLPTNAVLFPEL